MPDLHDRVGRIQPKAQMSVIRSSRMADVPNQRLLDRFLVGNADLEQLKARLSEFNLFRVLRVEEVEIRHSNVLAWLLDPAETHGLGPIFLRRFLSSVLMDVESTSFTPAEIELMKFGEVEVFRERDNIDILVRASTGRGASHVGWCLLIENKINAKESKDQLVRYREMVARNFPDDEIIPVFLTRDGDDPSEDGEDAGYIAFSHRQVRDVVDGVIKQHKTRIPNDASVFLAHYLNSLRRLTMDDDEELVELCKRIYRTHRAAIDLIVEYGGSNQRNEVCAAAIEELVLCDFPPKIANGRVWFVPKELGDEMPEVDMAGWKFLPRHVPACFWFRFSKRRQRAQLTLEIGPAADKSLRRRILKEAVTQKLPVKDKQFETAKYARLVTESMLLQVDTETDETDESEEYIRNVCKTLWSKVWPKAKPIVAAMESALKPEREAAKKKLA